MRSPLLKCLVVLLALALAAGNAHAALSLDAGPSDPCLGTHQHEPAPADHTGAHHDKMHHDDHGCCCECLGCTTAMDMMPSLALVPRGIALRIRFEQRTSALETRALDPELDPPRPGALI